MKLHPINRDGFANVLDLLLPHRLKTEREFRFNLLRHLSGNADAARVGNLLEAGCDVDTVAMPVGSLHDHFAEVDSNANIDPLILRLAGVSLCHSSLDIDRALNCVDDAAELGQEAIAHELEDAAAMLRYRRFNEFVAVSLDPLKGLRFVPLHQAAVSDNVSGKNGGEFSLHERTSGQTHTTPNQAKSQRQTLYQQVRHRCPSL